MSIITKVPVKSTLRTIINYFANSCRIAFFMGAGDVLMQHYNNGNINKKVNWQRTFKFATIGLCFMGPVLTYWSNSISLIIKASQYRSIQTLKQILWDQVYLAPCTNLGMISMSGLLSNNSVQSIENRISQHFPYIIRRHYMLWPAVQFFSSVCIQPSLQVGFANFVAILWYAYISGIIHEDQIFEQVKKYDRRQLLK